MEILIVEHKNIEVDKKLSQKLAKDIDGIKTNTDAKLEDYQRRQYAQMFEKIDVMTELNMLITNHNKPIGE